MMRSTANLARHMSRSPNMRNVTNVYNAQRMPIITRRTFFGGFSGKTKENTVKHIIKSYESCYAIVKLDDINNINKTGGRTPLMRAAEYASENNNLNVLKCLIKAGADLNVQDANGKTALMLAVGNNQIDAVKELIKEGAKLNIKDKKGNTALSLAVINNNIDIVKELINAGSKLNIGYELIEAIKNNHLDIAMKLLNSGAGVNVTDSDNITPLYQAVCNNKYDIAKQLIKKGAKVNIRPYCQKTIIEQAINHDNDSMLLLLINHGANLYSGQGTVFDNNFEGDILRLACRSNNIELIDALYKRNKNIMKLVFTYNKSHKIFKYYETTTHTATCLTYTCLSNKVSLDFVKHLVELGANIDGHDELDFTPLDYLVQSNDYTEIVKYLLKKGANPYIGQKCSKATSKNKKILDDYKKNPFGYLDM